jgi:hypothetical protein
MDIKLIRSVLGSKEIECILEQITAEGEAAMKQEMT